MTRPTPPAPIGVDDGSGGPSFPGALRSLRSLFESEPADGEIGSAVLDAPSADGSDEPLTIVRSFAFVDISGFTTYCDRHGAHAAIELLTRFRGTTRAVVARRGVRVGKWLGDGVMLVSVEMAPLAASVAEIAARCAGFGIDTHAGLATGPVLLFEGDDYVGRAANVAARLCEHAGMGEVLLHGTTAALPEWLTVHGHADVDLAGVGTVSPVQRVQVVDGVAEALRRTSPAA